MIINVETVCPLCHKKTIICVREKDYEEWLNSTKNIQDIFPYLSANAREMLQTGICPICWDSIFSDEDEE